MSLSVRRFPDTITRERGTPGHRNEHGEWVPGTVEETEFRASVQPLTLEDSNDVGGVSVSERLSVLVPVAGALVAAFDDSTADKVEVDGLEYTVESTQSWRNHHTRAIVIRET